MTNYCRRVLFVSVCLCLHGDAKWNGSVDFHLRILVQSHICSHIKQPTPPFYYFFNGLHVFLHHYALCATETAVFVDA